MRKLAAIILLFALFAQTWGNLVAWATYEMNRKYIAEHLCENRNKPCTHCNGKCYLRKQLQDNNEDGAKLPAPSFSNEDSFISDMPVRFSFLFLPQMQEGNLIPDVTNSYSLTLYTAIFHPPVLA